MANKNCLGACLIDLEKAFDTVWLDGLLYKLIDKKFPEFLIKIIWNMIYGRSFRIAHGNLISENELTISNGLQQGTINSPISFNIYTSDLLQLFESHLNNTHLIAYADDVIAYTWGLKPHSVQRILQQAINNIFNFYFIWKLSQYR